MKINSIVLLSSVMLCIASCSPDDDNNNGGKPAKLTNTIGTLHSGTSADIDLPEGYRIKSVGDYSFLYDSDGTLTRIYEEDDDCYEVTTNPFTIKCEYEEGYEKYNISFNSSGYISSISASYRWESSYNDDWEDVTYKVNYSYNSFGQVTQISGSSQYTDYDCGEKSSGTETIDAKFTYDSKHRLKTSTCTWDDKYERETETDTYEYDRDYPNTFYQYTPGLGDDDYGFIEPLVYLGLYGKASSALPTGAQVEEVEFDKEDGDYDEDSWYYEMGPYTFNSYGAIKSADDESYTYTSIGTRSATNQYDFPINISTDKKVTKRHHPFGLRHRCKHQVQ